MTLSFLKSLIPIALACIALASTVPATADAASGARVPATQRTRTGVPTRNRSAREPIMINYGPNHGPAASNGQRRSAAAKLSSMHKLIQRLQTGRLHIEATLQGTDLYRAVERLDAAVEELQRTLGFSSPPASAVTEQRREITAALRQVHAAERAVPLPH